MSELTTKQLRFVEEYILDLNATRAAIRAGYSEKGADTTGPRLLSDPRIIAAIDARKVDRSEQTKIDAEFVLLRLAREVNADIADVFDRETGDLKPVHEWPEIWRQGLVAGVEVEAVEREGGKSAIVKKVRFSDRLRRIELIGKHVRVNAFQEQVAVKGLDTLADRLERARHRFQLNRLVDLPAAPVPVVSAAVAPQTHAGPAPVKSIPVRSAAAPFQPADAGASTSPDAPAAAPALVAYRPVLPPWPEQPVFALQNYSALGADD